MTLSSPVAAQDWDKGFAAYKAGDFATALKEWQPLAKQGDVRGQFALGHMYEDGEGLPKDYAEAVKWFRLAAEQGYDKAQARLGSMYDNGEGVPQDYKEAVKWYRLAAKQGNDDAQLDLGILYLHGDAVLQDNVMAHMWFNLGATNGNPMARQLRGDISEKMSNAAIEKAQAMARECMSSGYERCGS